MLLASTSISTSNFQLPFHRLLESLPNPTPVIRRATEIVDDACASTGLVSAKGVRHPSIL